MRAGVLLVLLLGPAVSAAALAPWPAIVGPFAPCVGVGAVVAAGPLTRLAEESVEVAGTGSEVADLWARLEAGDPDAPTLPPVRPHCDLLVAVVGDDVAHSCTALSWTDRDVDANGTLALAFSETAVRRTGCDDVPSRPYIVVHVGRTGAGVAVEVRSLGGSATHHRFP